MGNDNRARRVDIVDRRQQDRWGVSRRKVFDGLRFIGLLGVLVLILLWGEFRPDRSSFWYYPHLAALAVLIASTGLIFRGRD